MKPSDDHARDENASRWSEADSERFADLGDVFVPARDEQIETICQLIPGEPGEVFSAVELGAGEGILARAVLERFPNCRVARLFARQWDAIVRGQSLATYGDLRAFDLFRRERWNSFADAEPDVYDQPSRLADQLLWLKEAGFADVDCFWMRAGHAIFGGYA